MKRGPWLRIGRRAERPVRVTLGLMAGLLVGLMTGLSPLASAAASGQGSQGVKVKITRAIPSITVTANGHPVVIKRDQNPQHTIAPEYAKTSRACPPYCVQPMQLLPGVHTIGTVEMIKLLQKRAAGDKSILIIDSRTTDEYQQGTIPSAVNIPWTRIYRGSSLYEPFIVQTLLTDRFGAKYDQGIWDFRTAKKLVLFCNGPWCGQSPTNIKELVSMGYPANKIYWYRGGMQMWHSLGLTTIQPEPSR